MPPALPRWSMAAVPAAEERFQGQRAAGAAAWRSSPCSTTTSRSSSTATAARSRWTSAISRMRRLRHSCLIPRFTLQPLVENAIFHGIEPKGSAGEAPCGSSADAANGDVLIRLTRRRRGHDAGAGRQGPAGARPRGGRRQIPPCGHLECSPPAAIQLWRGLRPDASRVSPGIGTTVTIRLPGPRSRRNN